MNEESINQLKQVVTNLVNTIESNEESLNRIWKILAKNQKAYFDELVAQGFNNELAIQILVATIQQIKGK